MTSSTSPIGPKACLILACTTWSTITILTPHCADYSFALLIFSRVALGAAEGLYIPACMALIASWYNADERATLVASGHMGQCLGAVVAMAAAPLAAYNWRILFYGFGALGLIWSGLFIAFGSDGPGRTSPSLPLGRTDLETQGYGCAPMKTKTKEATYSAILANPAFCAIVAAHFAYNWSWYLMLSWLPSYLVQSYGVSKDAVGQYAMWPFLVAACICISWARLADWCIQHHVLSLLHSRMLSQMVGCLGPTFALLTLHFLVNKSVIVAAVLVTCAVGFQTAAQSGCMANMIDVGGVVNSSRVAAASNTIATLPGAIGNIIVGFLLAGNGGWSAVFGTMITVHTLGLAAFLSLARADEVEF